MCEGNGEEKTEWVSQLNPGDVIIDCRRALPFCITVTVKLSKRVPAGLMLDLEWYQAKDRTRVRQLYRATGSGRMVFSVILEPGRYYLSAGLFSVDWFRCYVWMDHVQYLSIPAFEDHGTLTLAAWAKTSYRKFLDRYVNAVSDHAWRILRPEEGGDTVSEAIAYGMLLALAHGDVVAFDKFWSYAQSYLNRHGLMAWRIHANGMVIDSGSAADADQDMAYALIRAGQKWFHESYLNAGISMVQAMRRWESHKGYLKPGDAWAPVPEVFNPSYTCLSYYPVFSRVSHDPWWDEWAETSFGILQSVQHSETGLWPDWVVLNGALPQGFQSIFSYDALRVPWRLYVAASSGMACELNPLGKKISQFFLDHGLNFLRSAYSLSGDPLSSQISGALVAISALTRYAFTSDSRIPEFLSYLAEWTAESYYDAAIQALVLASLAGLLTFI